MGEKQRGQVSTTAAEIYDEIYLPALFEEWPPRIIDAVRIRSGQRVLDVACGTGVLARAVAEQVGPSGLTVGVDVNEGMLGIARKNAPEIDWRQAPAEALPLEDDSFDRVVCQFGLMYFADRQGALKEMMRVLRPGGRLALVVWDKLENSPGHWAEDRLWQRVFGDEEADDQPASLGDRQVLRQLLASAGIADADIETYEGVARYPSIESWIHVGVRGWTESEVIDDEQYDLLLREARKELTRFAAADGTVTFPTPAHIVTASKPGGRAS